ncbi:MAG: response regulator transcription factor [Actinobacteria bacterium]|nr:response regulator transcription factor [Actinomycetota bacterium]
MRVIVAEDVTLLREGIVRILEERGHEVVASLADAREILKAAKAFSPDVMIVDIRMPPTNTDDGLRAAIEVRSQINPKIPILILSQYVESFYASLLLDDDQEGIGYLLKDRVTNINKFMQSLEEVASGGTVLDPEVVEAMMSSSSDSSLRSLTPREREILALMAQGKSNAGIAEVVVITEGAVEKHISNILNKLGLIQEESSHRRVLAVIKYIEHS